jgi:polyhydroxybutyrate depolymerase
MKTLQVLAVLVGVSILQACSDGSDSINYCKGLSTESGHFPGLTIFSGGMERSYILYVPAIDDPSRPMPLVFNFHGRGSTGEAQFDYSEFAPLADIHKFIIVSPDGIGNTWNAGDCCGVAVEAAVDDVVFTADMIEQVSSEYCVDPDRIYASGMSNGGYLSYRLACEMADRFAAIGPVAARNRTVSCAPSRPVPMIAMNGTLDVLVEYSQAASDAEAWAAANQCSPESTVVYQQGDVTCVSYNECAQGATTEFCTVDGGGHNWPGAIDLRELDPEQFFWAGKTTQDIDGSAEIWRFFSEHPRP